MDKFQTFLNKYNGASNVGKSNAILNQISVVSLRSVWCNGKIFLNLPIRNKPHFIGSPTDSSYAKKVVDVLLVVIPTIFMKTKPATVVYYNSLTVFIFSLIKLCAFYVNLLIAPQNIKRGSKTLPLAIQQVCNKPFPFVARSRFRLLPSSIISIETSLIFSMFKIDKYFSTFKGTVFNIFMPFRIPAFRDFRATLSTFGHTKSIHGYC